MTRQLPLLLLLLVACCAEAKVRGTPPVEPLVQATPGPPLLPHTSTAAGPPGAVVVPARPSLGDAKRTVVLQWTYDQPPGTHVKAAIWVSVAQGPWREIGRTMPGETQYTYETTILDVQHCFRIAIFEGEQFASEHETKCLLIQGMPRIKDLSITVK